MCVKWQDIFDLVSDESMLSALKETTNELFLLNVKFRC